MAFVVLEKHLTRSLRRLIYNLVGAEKAWCWGMSREFTPMCELHQVWDLLCMQAMQLAIYLEGGPMMWKLPIHTMNPFQKWKSHHWTGLKFEVDIASTTEKNHATIKRGGRGAGAGGTGGLDPLKNHKVIGFLRNTGPDHLKNKANSTNLYPPDEGLFERNM